MNKNIQKLYDIAQKKERIIIGLMSGTSLDGLDIALCRFKNYGLDTEVSLLEFECVEYDGEIRENIKSIFSKRNIDLERLCIINPWLAIKQAKMINDCLLKWNLTYNDIDLLASHGQTIYHAPKTFHNIETFPNSTLQIVDGDHLAVGTQIITLSDFRQKNIAAGGEGAPLALYADYLLFSKKDENRVLLNIGGIANLSYLPASQNVAEIICSDIGPGNTLMDAFVQENFEGKNFDKNAQIAIKGKINIELIEALRKNNFFNKQYPKTTGPELFNLDYLKKAIAISKTENCSKEDILATLNKFTANCIVNSIKDICKEANITIYCSGGGIHNPLLMQHLKQSLPESKILNTDVLHINPDAKEAILFALLANESIAGNTKYGNATNKIILPISMGKISFPE